MQGEIDPEETARQFGIFQDRSQDPVRRSGKNPFDELAKPLIKDLAICTSQLRLTLRLADNVNLISLTLYNIALLIGGFYVLGNIYP
ncbi:hypothetical protein QBC42DRAFT_282385 [Cladorrhinum samala]|uniref:Uncharacterized protein n=1 Tax=Cladorrhinum samala TaxID=585594 RepID=A0AAV9HZJ7_9PEZI|nr:hypothetical protein QBC42DRAFT_282385 [Cladorrhinum samala]